MFLVIITTIVILLLTVISWKKYKDLTCPTVMFGPLWIISLLFAQLYSDVIYDISLSTMFIFSIGAILFHLGYFVGYNGLRSRNEDIAIKSSYFKPLIFIMGIFFSYVMYEFITKGVGDDVYNMLKNKENADLTLGGHFKKIVEFTTIGVLIIYWKTDSVVYQEKVKRYVVLLAIMGFLCAFSIPSRNAMLQFFLPLIVVYLCTHSLSVKKQVCYLLFGCVLFIGYYAYISSSKFSYKYEIAQNSEDVLSSEMQLYLSGSIVAFDQTIDQHSYTRMGRNTFRFFYALMDKDNAESLVNDFFSLGRLLTNVFTFYDFYLRDFGPLYALFMQFLIGIFHGCAYKKRNSAMGLYFLAMLSYPLVMQFFQDQYFSLTSTWIQIILTSFILYKTKLFSYRLS